MITRKKIFKPSFLLAALLSLAVFTPVSQAALVGNETNAVLTITAPAASYPVNTTFTATINVHTRSQNVVVASAYLNYDRTRFEATSIDTTGSVFSFEVEKTIDPVNGIIKITRGSPTPGVNTASGLVARVNFRTIANVSPTADNFTFVFTPGANTESNVIRDDGLGTDILSGVNNARVAITGGTIDRTPPAPPTGLVSL